MEMFERFEAVFGSGSDVCYHSKTIDLIKKNRRRLDNELFFDKLLKAVGIDEAVDIFPPRSNSQLRDIFKDISCSIAEDHHKQSLVYYILKDLNLKDRDATSFATKALLPNRYKIFIDGLWHLDHIELASAVECLTEPSLAITFPDKILYALCLLSKDEPALPLQYFQTVSPPLQSHEVLEAYYSVLCSVSITEAFNFARARDLITHRSLFGRLIAFVHNSVPGEERSAYAIEMIGLPFSQKEELWFREYLTVGKGKVLPGAYDSVMARLIVLGKVSEIDDTHKGHRNREIQGLDWSTLVQGFTRAA